MRAISFLKKKKDCAKRDNPGGTYDNFTRLGLFTSLAIRLTFLWLVIALISEME